VFHQAAFLSISCLAHAIAALIPFFSRIDFTATLFFWLSCVM
jgi:hypothetical protein